MSGSRSRSSLNSLGTGFKEKIGINTKSPTTVSPKTAYPAASCTNPEIESEPNLYAHTERNSALIILLINAKTIDIATSATFFHILSRKTAAKNDPENRHAVRLRMPLHASATPTAPSGKNIELPRSSTKNPAESIMAVTMIATFESKKRLIAFSHTEKNGEAIIQAKAGKRKRLAKYNLSRTDIFCPSRFSAPAKYINP